MSRGIRSAIVDALVMAFAIAAVAGLATAFGGPAEQRIVAHAAILLVLVVALQVFSGNSGIVSFGHAAFAGIGAYVVGTLTIPAAVQAVAFKTLPDFLAGWQLPLFGALAVAVVVAILVGLITGTPLIRLSGSSAGIMTLALLIIIYTLLAAARDITRGTQPFYGVPRNVGLWTAVPVAIAALAFARIFRDTPVGLATRAAAADERGAAAIGVDRRSVRLVAWVASVVIAALSGGLTAQFLGSFSPKDFYFDMQFTVLAMLIVGGMGSSLGALAGVVVTTVVIEVVRRFEGGPTIAGFELPVFFGLQEMALALAMLIVIWRRPEGLTGGREIDLLRRLGRLAAPRPAPAPPPRQAVPAIVVENLTRRYAGVVAVDDVSLVLDAERITGIIGPNGAGKTTLINMIAGDVVPTSGTVRFEGVEGRPSAHRFARAGLARTFQNIRIFPQMTVLENVLVAARQMEPSLAAAEAAAMRDLALLDLATLADRPASSLPYGLRRRLEVARALALRPRFLLLDEPAAGMNAVETATLMETLSKVRAERGIGIVLIEHDMRLVMRLCERIVVIDHGRVIADGAPAAVQNDPAVVAAYLGSRTGAAVARQSAVHNPPAARGDLSHA